MDALLPKQIDFSSHLKTYYMFQGVTGSKLDLQRIILVAKSMIPGFKVRVVSNLCENDALSLGIYSFDLCSFNICGCHFFFKRYGKPTFLFAIIFLGFPRWCRCILATQKKKNFEE